MVRDWKIETGALVQVEQMFIVELPLVIYFNCSLFNCMQNELSGWDQRKWLNERKREMLDRWREIEIREGAKREKGGERKEMRGERRGERHTVRGRESRNC